MKAEGLRKIGDHGGSLSQARALFAHAPEPWIDLSTGISPHSYPLFTIPATAFRRLPEPERVAELADAAARAYGAPTGDHVAIGPGTQILLPRVAALRAPGKARVLAPTYAEHARAAALVGHEVEEVTDVTALAEADLAIVVNPNNPDGRVVPRSDLLALADRLAAKGGLVMVDEAFMDVGPRSESLAPDVRPGLVVLRSFGKFFGLAGIRLGFALSDSETTEKISAEFGPWAVSGLALEIGLRALNDIDWQETTRERLKAKAARLDGLFQRRGVKVAGGTALYRYIRTERAQALFTHLGGAGIMVRRFSFDPEALRVGLPGKAAEWKRLDEALARWPA